MPTKDLSVSPELYVSVIELTELNKFIAFQYISTANDNYDGQVINALWRKIDIYLTQIAIKNDTENDSK